jgi:hypothetical protein
VTHQLVASAARGAHRHPSRPAVSDTERALREAEHHQNAAISAARDAIRRHTERTKETHERAVRGAGARGRAR